MSFLLKYCEFYIHFIFKGFHISVLVIGLEVLHILFTCPAAESCTSPIEMFVLRWGVSRCCPAASDPPPSREAGITGTQTQTVKHFYCFSLSLKHSIYELKNLC